MNTGTGDAVEAELARIRAELAALGRQLDAIAAAIAVLRGEAPGPRPCRDASRHGHLRAVE